MKHTTMFASVFLALSVVVGGAATLQYAGNPFIYFAFSAVSVALIFNGFRRGALFFDTFVAIFLWLGFWLKFSVRTAFLGGNFWEPVGAFDGSAIALDRGLLVASFGMLGVLIATMVRRRFFQYRPAQGPARDEAVELFYRQHRTTIVVCFVLLVVGVSASNLLLGIYQRGMQPQTVLPWGLGGVYKWLLQFGLASFAAVIVRYELQVRENGTWLVLAVPLFEAFLSNISLLSRGMVLNASAIAVGIWCLFNFRGRQLTPLRITVALIAFLVLFASSVFVVNYIRSNEVYGGGGGRTVDRAQAMTTPLFIDRWVGIEGVLAVTSSEKRGWVIWGEAWQERYQNGALSLYDREFIDSPYRNPELDMRRHHFVSLPGAIAFFYYPGSLSLLVGCVAVFVWLGSAIEWLAYSFSGKNLVLSALIGQVVAFRFASFGYVPRQSYLLFGTIILNVVLIALLIWAVRKYADRMRIV